MLQYVLDKDTTDTSAIQHQERRRISLLARGLLRYLYAAFFHETQLAQPQIYKSATGRPYIYDDWRGMHFYASISHSRDAVAVAIDRQDEIGIDVEYCRRERNWRAIAGRIFPSTINMYLESAEDFYQAWCIYEAWGKANNLKHIHAEKNTKLMQLIEGWLGDRTKPDRKNSALTLFTPADNYFGCIYRTGREPVKQGG